jgi:UDP-N-acetylmuramoyl-L-alanyl-D-glutamate--2,6-diaminopimelate ligase
MGNIANHYADFVCITNDNPRNENPNQIAGQICEGISCLKNYLRSKKSN